MASYNERRGQIDPGVQYATPNASNLIGQLGDFVDARTKALQGKARQAKAVAGTIEQERANEQRRQAVASGEPVDITKPWLVREEAKTFMSSEYADAFNGAAREVFHSQVQTELMEKLSDLKQQYKHDPNRKRGNFLVEANKIVASTRQMLAAAPETRDLAQAEFTQYAEKFAQQSYMDVVMEDHNIATKALVLDYKKNLHKRIAVDTDMMIEQARASADPLRDFEANALPMIRATQNYIDFGLKSQFTTGDEWTEVNDTYAHDWVARYKIMLWERDQANALNKNPTDFSGEFISKILNNGAFFDKNQFELVQKANAAIDDKWGGQINVWADKWMYQAVESRGGKFGSFSEVEDRGFDGKPVVLSPANLIPMLRQYANRFGAGDPRYNVYMSKADALENLSPLFDRLKNGDLTGVRATLATWMGGKRQGDKGQDKSQMMPLGDKGYIDQFKKMVDNYYNDTMAAVRSGDTGKVLSNVGAINDYSAKIVRERVRNEYLRTPEKFLDVLKASNGDVQGAISYLEREAVKNMMVERAQKAGRLVAMQGMDPMSNSYTLWSSEDAAEYAGEINRALANGETKNAVKWLNDYLEISGRSLKGSEAAALRQLDIDGKQGIGTAATVAWALSGENRAQFNELFTAAASGMKMREGVVPKDIDMANDVRADTTNLARSIGVDPSAVDVAVYQAWKYYYSTQAGMGGDAKAYADTRTKALVNYNKDNIQELDNKSVVMLPQGARGFDAETKMNNLVSEPFRQYFADRIDLPMGVDTRVLRFESRVQADGKKQMVLVRGDKPVGSADRVVRWRSDFKGQPGELEAWYNQFGDKDWFPKKSVGGFIPAAPASPVGFLIER